MAYGDRRGLLDRIVATDFSDQMRELGDAFIDESDGVTLSNTVEGKRLRAIHRAFQSYSYADMLADGWQFPAGFTEQNWLDGKAEYFKIVQKISGRPVNHVFPVRDSQSSQVDAMFANVPAYNDNSLALFREPNPHGAANLSRLYALSLLEEPEAVSSAIDAHKYRGVPVSPDQDNAFPRVIDGVTIPIAGRVRRAYEIEIERRAEIKAEDFPVTPLSKDTGIDSTALGSAEKFRSDGRSITRAGEDDTITTSELQTALNSANEGASFDFASRQSKWQTPETDFTHSPLISLTAWGMLREYFDLRAPDDAGRIDVADTQQQRIYDRAGARPSIPLFGKSTFRDPAPQSGRTSGPSPMPSGGGIDQEAVDARIRALVSPAALIDDVTRWAVAKLGRGVAGATKVLFGDGTWKDAPAGGGAGIDATARRAAQAAADQAETNRVEIGRNSQAVVLARQEAQEADRKAQAAQDDALDNDDVDGRIQAWVSIPGNPANLEDAIEVLFRDNFDFADMPGAPSIGAGQVGKFLKVESVNTTTGEIVLAWATPAGGGSQAAGDDAASWAEAGNTSVIPKGKIPHYLTVYPSTNPATIQSNVGGEKNQDLVIGYSATEIAIFRFSQSANAFQLVVKWQRGERSDSALETFIENIVEPWAVKGNADGIPGSKTFDGLFKSEQETSIPAANTAFSFGVGTTNDGNETDETDAAATSFNITAQQANQPGGFLRVKYVLARTAAEGPLPRDIELLLQNPSTGATITKHNLKDEGSGTAQFAFGDAGRKRWAVRQVTTGRYVGRLTITEATFHSGTPLADDRIAHVVHPIVSDEAEKRQAEDKRLTAEIARVELVKAIVNGLPAATVTRKGAIAYRADRKWEQTEADAFQVPETGFVQFILGNIGATGIMRVEDCHNRKHIVYALGNHEIALNFSATRKAVLTARQTRNNTLSNLAPDITPNLPSPGFVMLHWAPARADTGASTHTLAELSRGLDAVEQELEDLALPNRPAHTNTPKRYELSVPARTGPAQWVEAAAASSGLSASQVLNLIAVWARDGNAGRVPVQKLGAGAASASKVLYGDGAWKDAPSGGLTETLLFNKNVSVPVKSFWRPEQTAMANMTGFKWLYFEWDEATGHRGGLSTAWVRGATWDAWTDVGSGTISTADKKLEIFLSPTIADDGFGNNIVTGVGFIGRGSAADKFRIGADATDVSASPLKIYGYK